MAAQHAPPGILCALITPFRQDQAFDLTLCTRGTDVVLAQGLEQTRPQEAAPLRNLQQRQHDHWQDQVPHAIE